MASIITHVAIPISLCLIVGKPRVTGRLLFFAMVASMLPDIDVVAFKFGIPYESAFGHRGFTHSIVFALCIASFGMIFHRTLKCTKTVVFSILFLSTLSHPLLDAMTNGGLGVALYWPIDDTRMFLPWRSIQVSPIGVKNFISERGLLVLWSEFKLVWLPCIAIVMTLLLFKKSVQKSRN